MNWTHKLDKSKFNEKQIKPSKLQKMHLTNKNQYIEVAKGKWPLQARWVERACLGKFSLGGGASAPLPHPPPHKIAAGRVIAVGTPGESFLEEKRSPEG